MGFESIFIYLSVVVFQMHIFYVYSFNLYLLFMVNDFKAQRSLYI